MIKKVDMHKVSLRLHEPFAFASNEIQNTEVVMVKIVDENGLCGIGSGSPYFPETGETADSVLKILRKKLNNRFFDLPIDNWYGYHEKIQAEFAGFPAAQTAVETAVMHLFSITNKIPVSKLLGGYRTTCSIMMSVGLKSIDKTINEIKEKQKAGFTVFKLKVGVNLDEDLLKIKHVKKILGNESSLILDANEGYSLPEAKRALNALQKYNIAAFEQPIKAKNWRGLKQLSQLNIIPIIADQSITDTQAALTLLNNNIVDGVNVKLMKCGGIVNYLKIFHTARSLNKITMIGCMSESNISITAGAWIALGLPIDYIDLDSGHLDFPNEPGRGGAMVKNGKLSLGKKMYLK